MTIQSIAAEGTHQTARAAGLVAETYTTETIFLANRTRSESQTAKVADWIRAGIYDFRAFTMQDRARLIDAVGLDTVNMIQTIMLTAESARLWRNHRIVYRVHPELAAPLTDSKMDSAIPCEVFRRLPHPNPFIAFPTPIPSGEMETKFELISEPEYIGMLVTGYTEDLNLCSTDDPELGYLNVALASRLQYVGQQQPTYEEKTLRIPVRGHGTVDEILNDHLGRIDWHTVDESDTFAYQLVVALLLYLCSDQQDLSKPAARGTSKKSRKQDNKSKVMDIGFTIGPKLFAARRASSSNTDKETGKTVRSHLRRAHWHTFKTGPQRKKPVVRWLHPILVHPETQEPAQPTIIDADPAAAKAANK